MNVENEHYMREIVKYYHIINGRDCYFLKLKSRMTQFCCHMGRLSKLTNVGNWMAIALHVYGHWLVGDPVRIPNELLEVCQ